MVELVTERHLINLSKREADLFISFVHPAGQRLVVEKVGRSGWLCSPAPTMSLAAAFPKTVQNCRTHTFVDYVEDLVAIQPVHWLLDVLEPTSVSFRSSSMHAQQNAVAAGAGIGLLPLFSAKTNPELLPVLAQEVKVYRDVICASTKTWNSWAVSARSCAISTNVFTRDAGSSTSSDAAAPEDARAAKSHRLLREVDPRRKLRHQLFLGDLLLDLKPAVLDRRNVAVDHAGVVFACG